MAKNDTYVYRLTPKGRELGIHTIATPPDADGPGVQMKVDKYGVVRVPHPGLPHPDAHHLKHVHTESPGGEPYALAEEADAHMAAKKAEDTMKEAAEVLAGMEKAAKDLPANATEKDKKAAGANVEAAKGLLDEAKAAFEAADKKAAGRPK